MGCFAFRGDSHTTDPDMNKTLGFQLALYSLLLAGGSYFTHHQAPTLTQPTFIAGLAGGVLCLGWGVRAIAGHRGKALPILTLIPVAFVLLSQTVLGWWSDGNPAVGQRTVALLTTLLLVLTIGMLMRIAYAGLSLDGSPGGSAQAARKPADAVVKPTQSSGRTSKLS